MLLWHGISNFPFSGIRFAARLRTGKSDIQVFALTVVLFLYVSPYISAYNKRNLRRAYATLTQSLPKCFWSNMYWYASFRSFNSNTFSSTMGRISFCSIAAFMSWNWSLDPTSKPRTVQTLFYRVVSIRIKQKTLSRDLPSSPRTMVALYQTLR